MTASLYLTVYAGNDLPTSAAEVASKSLGTVDAASELEYRAHLHGTGSGSVKINRYHTQAALLQQDRYVLVHSDAGVVGGFFLDSGDIGLTDQNGKGAEFLVWSGVGPMGVLRNGTMDADSNITGGHDPIDGYWDLDNQGPLAGDSNAHPIPMMKRVLVEMDLNTPNGIAVVDHSSWTYDTDSASAAVPFLDGEAQGAAVGDTGLDLIARFDQMGGVVFVMSPLFKLDAYLTYGTDRSGAFAADTVRFEKGVNIAAAVQRKVRGAVNRTHLTVEGADKTFVTVTDPDYTAGDIVRWGYLSVPETSESAQLTAAGLAHIALRKRQTDAWTFPQHDHGDDPANGIYEPAPDIADGHYWLGDSVALHTGSGTYDADEETVPIAAITWQLKTGREANGDYWVIPEVGSTFNWSAGDASFTSNITPAKGNRLCFCTTTISGGEVVTGYEGPFTWDSGEEFLSGGGGQLFDQDTAFALAGANGTPYCGHMGFAAGDGNSAEFPCSAGTTYRFAGYTAPGGESWPYVSQHGNANYSVQVNWYSAGGALLGSNTLASYTDVAGAWRAFSADATAPTGAAHFKIGQNGDALPGAPNSTRIDELDVSTVSTSAAVKGTDEFTGSEPCAARCDHKHHANEVVLDNGDTVQEFADAEFGTHAHAAADVGIEDAGDYFTDETVEGALQETGPRLIPAGGTTGQVLAKATATDYDIEWADQTGGGGAGGGGAYAETIGDGVATSIQVTHSLGTKDVLIELWDVSGTDPVLVPHDAADFPTSVTVDDTDNLTLVFGSAPATDEFRVVVLAGGSGSSPSPVQEKPSGQAQNVSSYSLVMDSTPTNDMLLAWACEDSTTTISSISQTGVTWTRLNRTVVNGFGHELWHGTGTASTATVSVTMSASQWSHCAVVELSGLTGTLDNTQSGNGRAVMLRSTAATNVWIAQTRNSGGGGLSSIITVGAPNLFPIMQDRNGAIWVILEPATERNVVLMPGADGTALTAILWAVD